MHTQIKLSGLSMLTAVSTESKLCETSEPTAIPTRDPEGDRLRPDLPRSTEQPMETSRLAGHLTHSGLTPLPAASLPHAGADDFVCTRVRASEICKLPWELET